MTTVDRLRERLARSQEEGIKTIATAIKKSFHESLKSFSKASRLMWKA